MDNRIPKNIISSFFALFVLTVCAKQNSQELFLQANKTYSNAQYKQASLMYKSINPKGRAVWYNLGNCHYQLEQYPDAILCWRKAQKNALMAEQPNITTNLSSAYQKIGREYHPPSRFNMVIKSFSTPFATWLLQFLLVLSWYLLFWLIFFQPRSLRYYYIILCVNLCVAFGLMIAVYFRYKEENVIGVVMKNQTAVLSGPQDDYHTLYTLPLADEVVINERRPGWYKIVRSGKSGWVSIDNITII